MRFVLILCVYKTQFTVTSDVESLLMCVLYLLIYDCHIVLLEFCAFTKGLLLEKLCYNSGVLTATSLIVWFSVS